MKRNPSKTRYMTFTIIPALFAFTLVAIVGSCTQESADATPHLIFKKAPKSGVVAKIGDETITEEELLKNANLTFYQLRKKAYQLKMEQLNQLMKEKLLLLEQLLR